ncbi:hypothetical protein YPPY13_4641, partial [Yersinia pestis PY-13]|jgi:hypothetical protein
MT